MAWKWRSAVWIFSDIGGRYGCCFQFSKPIMVMITLKCFILMLLVQNGSSTSAPDVEGNVNKSFFSVLLWGWGYVYICVTNFWIYPRIMLCDQIVCYVTPSAFKPLYITRNSSYVENKIWLMVLAFQYFDMDMNNWSFILDLKYANFLQNGSTYLY